MLARLQQNLEAIRDRIAAAARRVGRQPSEITLVAVTKYVNEQVAQLLIEAGCRDLGESRPQELWKKADALASAGVRWHLIGHLQRNKLARTLPLVRLIHSLDRLSLAQEIQQLAPPVPARVLLEVNVSGDRTKHGVRPDEAVDVVRQLANFRHLILSGFMTMGAREGDDVSARQNFADLRALRDRCRAAAISPDTCTELSMGMSGDFEIAIEEGATIVRVGSALFTGIEL